MAAGGSLAEQDARAADPGKALWQITISGKCNQPCDPTPQGVSAQFKLYADGTGEGNVTGLGFPVAGHQGWDVDGWTIVPDGAGVKRFVFTGGTITIPSAQLEFPISPLPFFTFIPAAVGHHDHDAVLGATAEPGRTFQIQVSHPGPASFWEPAQDFLFSPDQANPSPDSYGNPGVWSYMSSPTLSHDPGSYELLPRYPEDNRWDHPDYVNLLIGVRRTVPPTLAMHSWGGREAGENVGRSAILAWTSPIAGKVIVRGTITLPPLALCPIGTGSIWSIDKGSDTLHSTTLPGGGSTAFELSTEIGMGETLYFVHDPGENSFCDTASVALTIEA